MSGLSLYNVAYRKRNVLSKYFRSEAETPEISGSLHANCAAERVPTSAISFSVVLANDLFRDIAVKDV